MFSWGLVVENPYYSITQEDGAYQLKDIPAGEYDVAVWHPGMKAYLEKKVLVEAGRTATLDFQYEAPQGRRSVHEMQENPHFGLEILGEGVEIVPSLRRQIP
jgi:hypothetical protein